MTDSFQSFSFTLHRFGIRLIRRLLSVLDLGPILRSIRVIGEES